MDSVLRAAAIYIGLMIIMRFAGKRSLAQITTFDFVLLLIISEATQQAMLGQDFSVTNALLVIVTLVMLDIGLSLLKRRSKTIDKLARRRAAGDRGRRRRSGRPDGQGPGG